jgi:squalene synthase HpnC
MPVDHYENFPVASLLLPARIRPAVETIYWFARSADDLADEGDALPEARLSALNQYESELDSIARNESSTSPLFHALANVIKTYQLPIQPFRDLLSAFKQDVVTTRYATFSDLLDYCRRSADPVGRLMLHLYRANTEENIRDADSICSALQIINFLQDVAIDWKKSRIYLPQEDLKRFQVTEQHFIAETPDSNWQRLMEFQVARAKNMMLSGAPLCLRLTGRISWELRLVVQGGLRILESIQAAKYDVYHHRPQLTKGDWPRMAWRAYRMKAQIKPSAISHAQ